MPVLAVDIGGTWIRAGRVGRDHARPAVQVSTPTSADLALQKLDEAITIALRDVGGADRIVVSCGGLIDRDGSVVKSLYTPFAGTNLRSHLQNAYGMRAFVHNDAHLQFLGLPRSNSQTALLTWGTGVGGALGYRGELLSGHNNFAGEFGHSFRGSSSRMCQCGSQGCLDLTASGHALVKELGEVWYDNLFPMPPALKTAITDLAIGARQLSRLFGPRALFLSGRIFELSVVRQLMRSTINEDWSRCRLAFCPNTWALVMRGAARVVDLKS